jgi:AcrR family transcriptional regulator
MMPRMERKLTRREEYAQATRQAILDAARKLFSEGGYFATKVDDIAAEARVAPATVYAAGGKSGLLDALVQAWITDPLVEGTISRILGSDDPVEVIRLTANAVRTHRERWSDVIQVVRTTAPHDNEVAEQLKIATDAYRSAFGPTAEKLAELDALAPDVDVPTAVDYLWFYFGYSSYFTLHDDNHWSYDRAEQWLGDQACRTLLAPG